MFEILRAGNGAWFTLVSKNEILEGTRKVAIEAIRSRPNPSRGPRFARKNIRGIGRRDRKRLYTHADDVSHGYVTVKNLWIVSLLYISKDGICWRKTWCTHGESPEVLKPKEGRIGQLFWMDLWVGCRLTPVKCLDISSISQQMPSSTPLFL